MPDIEIAFFGVTGETIGKGAGRALLAHCAASGVGASTRSASGCTLARSDHPSALGFYMKFGFVPYKRAVEIEDDPRVTGEMPRSAAPHVPIV